MRTRTYSRSWLTSWGQVATVLCEELVLFDRSLQVEPDEELSSSIESEGIR
jgi:hypothetical protein